MLQENEACSIRSSLLTSYSVSSDYLLEDASAHCSEQVLSLSPGYNTLGIST